MICANCGAKGCQEKRENYPFVESGLSGVTLVNVPVRRCPSCEDVEVVIPRLPELHRLLAELLIRKKSPLAAEEFRYLRKHLGLSSTDFAQKAGVTLETVSRWESGRHPLDPPAERLVRIMVATSKPVEKYPEDVFPSEKKSKRPPKPAQVRVSAPKKSTGAWAMTAAA